MRFVVTVFAAASASLAACAHSYPHEIRMDAIRRAQVWTKTNVSAMDIKTGPTGEGAFAPDATVNCEYVEKKMTGRSPKFTCKIGADDEVKVKFGPDNGEVYGEVAASRLFWALGFGADRMYPVKVVCRNCPPNIVGTDVAVIERKLPGREIESDIETGWAFRELDLIDADKGGATRAERDALKLLAVFLQHTDSKPQQQRIVCLGGVDDGACNRPFLMISDVGLTFGTGSRANLNDVSGANLARWRGTPVWRDEPGCVGNIDKSFSGTLERPVIGEAGRRFLATLLQQLSDAQLHDLFDVARVNLRVREPGKALSGFPSIDEWVAVFKAKRDEIVSKRCA